MVATVLGGYFVFSKSGYGGYKYMPTLKKESRDTIKEAAIQLLNPNTSLMETDNLVIIKAIKMEEYLPDDY